MDYQTNPEVSEGDAFAPFEGTNARAGAPPPKVAACDAFKLVYDSRRYTVMGGRVVPNFRRVVYTPGINGCDELRDRKTGDRIAVKPGAAMSQAMDSGGLLIDFSWVPESQWRLHNNGGKSYLWCPKGRPDVHLTIWTECFPGSEEISVNEPAYLAWIAWLEETGKIPPAPLHILRRLLSQRVEERNALADKAQNIASLRPEVEHRTKDIEAIKAAIEKRTAEYQRTPSEGAAFTPSDEDMPAPTTRKGRA